MLADNGSNDTEANSPADEPVVSAAPVTQTRAAARAKLDIAIDDDED